MTQEATTQDNGSEERLDHEAAAELFHDDHRLDRAAAKATLVFGERRCKQAELGEGRPVLALPA